MIEYKPALALLLALLIAHTTSADEVTIVSDRWYPYNGTPNSPLPGYVIEIAEYSLTKAGHTVKYQLWSWEQAIELVSQGKRDCLIGDYRSSMPNYPIPDQHMGVDQTVFVTRKESNWQYNGIASIKNLRLGTIHGYKYTPEMHEYIKTQPKNLSATKGKFALELNLSALVNGQLDAVVDSRNVLIASLNKQSWLQEVRFAGELNQPYKIHIACSPKKPQSIEYVSLINEGLTELRNSGQLELILKKYGLSDWQHLPAQDN